MGHEITAIIAAQLADPEALLSETLYIRVSPQMKRELADYAKERHVSLTDLLIEAFGLLHREHQPLDMAPSRDYGPYPRGQRHDRRAAQGR